MILLPENKNKIKINIEGEWSLENLYEFPYLYSQVYSFLYSILEPVNNEKRGFTFESHPWIGGYSSLNFYSYLKTLVPRQHRPRIVSIYYASPGWIELALVVYVAKNLREIIKNIIGSFEDITSYVNKLYKQLHERKLIRIRAQREHLKLSIEEVKFLRKASEDLSKMIGFKDLAELNQFTKSPLMTLKILLSFYRRLRRLAQYERKKKIIF